MKKIRKQITLIEVLIALALTSLVLSAITWVYMAISKMETSANVKRQQVFRVALLGATLSRVMPTIKDLLFVDMWNESPSLVFAFNNGPDLDKDFGHKVIGRIYLDDDKNLSLAIMPHPKEWDKIDFYPVKNQVLLESVKKVSFRFFSWSEKEGTISNGWHEEWPKKLKQIPAIVELDLEFENGNKKQYRYVIPSAKEVVDL
jgi:hypothetical protein